MREVWKSSQKVGPPSGDSVQLASDPSHSCHGHSGTRVRTCSHVTGLPWSWREAVRSMNA